MHPDSMHNRFFQTSVFDKGNLVLAPSFMAPDIQEEQLQQPAANLLGVYDPGLRLTGLCHLSGCLPNQQENELASGSSRKRRRQVQKVSCEKRTFISLQPESNATFSFATPQDAAGISIGLSISDTFANPAIYSTTNRCKAQSLSSIIMEKLQSEARKQKNEIDQFIILQGERLKHALEQESQRHIRCLLEAIEKGVIKRLNDTNAELEKVNRRNLVLEEHVKQLSLESQIWQNTAKNSMIVVSNLRARLEQVIEPNDAESCHYGETGDDVHALMLKENKKMKVQRSCSACRMNDICILLLPCRHLCLCKDCEGKLEICPVCRSVKSASVQVHMS